MADVGVSNLVNQVRRYCEFSRRLFRRWWLIVLLTVVGAGISTAVALLMTRVYESRTLITWKEGVARSRLFAGEEPETRAENWLQPRIEQLVSSHTRLWRLAQELDLFAKERRTLAPEVVLEELRKSIKHGAVGLDSFWIAFEYRDPYKAQQAAARLAREFVEQNVGDRVRVARVTKAFMETEVNKVKLQLDEIESQLAQFVADHPEFQIDPATGLPRASGPAIAGAAQPAIGAYASVRNPELRRLLTHKGRLEAQLQLATNPAGDPRVDQARQDLAQAQSLLASKRRQYTEAHPDVQRARRYLAQMQLQLQQARQESTLGSGSEQRLRAELSELDRAIARLSQAPLAARAATADPERDADRHVEGLSRTAELEKRWYQLTRDREITKAKYDQLSERFTRARVTASLETARAETQFVIVDRANLPDKPIRPSRAKVVMAGSGLGLLLGLALAVLVAIMDPRIYTEEDLRRASELPLLAQIQREA